MSNFRPATEDSPVLVNLRHDMAVYDTLPPVIRHALASAPVPYAAIHAAGIYRNMAPEYVADLIGAAR